jgi:hypothetical protein
MTTIAFKTGSILQGKKFIARKTHITEWCREGKEPNIQNSGVHAFWEDIERD